MIPNKVAPIPEFEEVVLELLSVRIGINGLIVTIFSCQIVEHRQYDHCSFVMAYMESAVDSDDDAIDKIMHLFVVNILRREEICLCGEFKTPIVKKGALGRVRIIALLIVTRENYFIMSRTTKYATSSKELVVG
jgi:hypothetical protein